MMPSKFVIYDTEYTAWEGSVERNWSDPGEHRELIQLGALKVELDSDGFEQRETMLMCCKPSINPVLSDYIQKLTGISQDQILNEGAIFETLLIKFFEFCEAGTLPIFSWTRTDDQVLRENCELNQISFPSFAEGFYDVRNIFISLGIDVSGTCSGEISQRLGKTVPGQVHNALHDAMSIFEALKIVYRKKKTPSLEDLISLSSIDTDQNLSFGR